MHLRWLKLKPPTIEGNFYYHTYINKYRLSVSFSFSRLPRIEIRGWGGEGRDCPNIFGLFGRIFAPKSADRKFTPEGFFCTLYFLPASLLFGFTCPDFLYFHPYFISLIPEACLGETTPRRRQRTWGRNVGARCLLWRCIRSKETLPGVSRILFFFLEDNLGIFLNRCFYHLFLFICIVLFKFSSSGWYTRCDEFYISSSFLFTICNVFCFFCHLCGWPTGVDRRRGSMKQPDCISVKLPLVWLFVDINGTSFPEIHHETTFC